MDSSVVRISLFVSNNYNVVVIYQPYTSIKYARYITILKHGGYRFNQPQPETTTDPCGKDPRGKVSLIYYFYTIYIYISNAFKHNTLVKKHVSTSLKTHLTPRDMIGSPGTLPIRRRDFCIWSLAETGLDYS